jgi:hypothetical protein
MEVLSIPFRLQQNGRAERVWQGSEAHVQQQAAQFVATMTGELPLSPFYGMDDPTFRTVRAGEVVIGMAQFHPEVDVRSVIVLADAGGMSEVYVDVSGGEEEAVTVQQEQSVVFNA